MWRGREELKVVRCVMLLLVGDQVCSCPITFLRIESTKGFPYTDGQIVRVFVFTYGTCQGVLSLYTSCLQFTHRDFPFKSFYMELNFLIVCVCLIGRYLTLKSR